MAIITTIGNACSTSQVITLDNGAVDFTFDISNASPSFKIEKCTPICDNPQIVSHLIEGDSFIPFVLNMPDGTKVKETVTGSSGFVYDNKGVIELGTPLLAGDTIGLEVEDENCQAKSC